MNLCYKNENNIPVIESFKRKEGEPLPLLTYPALSELPFISHGFSTREGGVSTGIFESLNFSFSRGDDPESVHTNYARLAEVFDVSVSDIVTSDQTHTTNIRLVTADDAGKGITKERDYTDVDGLITDTRGLLLSTFYADCVPLFFVDPIHKAIGLSHSGWRGTCAKMGRETIFRMKEAFGTNAKDLICAIGPSICQDCYEVSEDVAVEFVKAFPTHEEEILKKSQLKYETERKYQLDLWKANEIILTEAGILKEHISVTGLCTCCNEKYLFSHRASRGQRGNLGAFLMLK